MYVHTLGRKKNINMTRLVVRLKAGLAAGCRG